MRFGGYPASICLCCVLAWTAPVGAAQARLAPSDQTPFDQAQSTARLLAAAQAQIGRTLVYDPSYQHLGFPGGDVPLYRGVCADVVVRALRGVGVDLQREVNRDMRAHFAAYPQRWGMRGPDPNIDQRRVPNLETWFGRHGMALAPSRQAQDYRPGDIVSWRLERGRPHIGIVSDRRSRDGLRPLVIHNIGYGVWEQDVLFDWQISGHFRYFHGLSASRAGQPGHHADS